MIQINTITNTEGGLALPLGILLNVNPQFEDYIDENGLTKYDIFFSIDIYKDMSDYLVKKVLTRDCMVEFNIGYKENNVNIQALTSVSSLLELLSTHIEDGGGIYPGVGADNTSIVFPPVV